MKKLTAYSIAAALLFGLILSSCGYASEGDSAELFLAPEADYAAAEEAAEAFDSDRGEANLKLDQVQERLIIRSGSLDVVIQDTEESIADIGRMADRMGGWVVTSSVYQRGEAKAGSITLRIPANQFDTAMNQIKDGAIEVRSESTNSQDVTEEYVDLEARLENMEATADRVRSFLDEARNVEEALAVNQELSRLEGDIESMKGRMEYLSQSAAFSSLEVYLTPDELSQPIEVAGWRPEGVAKTAIETLISAFQAIANVAIWAVIFCLPLGVLLGVPAYFIIRTVRRRRRKPASEEEE